MAERSKAYPGVPLSECVESLKRVKRAVGGQRQDRATIGRSLGKSEATVIRLVAAMVHFGLLDRNSKGYSVSELGRIIVDPVGDELPRALKEAIRQPTLYSEVLDRFEPEGFLPEQLSTVLHRHFGITDKAASLAADVLKESLVYARIITQEGRFVDQDVDPMAESGSENVGYDSELVHSARNLSDPIRATGIGEQVFSFRLASGSLARLSVPLELSAKDIALLRKQIELLELQIKDD